LARQPTAIPSLTLVSMNKKFSHSTVRRLGGVVTLLALHVPLPHPTCTTPTAPFALRPAAAGGDDSQDIGDRQPLFLKESSDHVSQVVDLLVLNLLVHIRLIVPSH
jgi:hypothetical protein